MWRNDGRGSPGLSQPGMPEQVTHRAPGKSLVRPDVAEGMRGADVREHMPGMEGADDARMVFPGRVSDVSTPASRRVRARQLLREFLQATPRAEMDTALEFIRPDGVERKVTRAEVSAAVDRLRPRMRQIIRLALEERWSRQRVCEYLRISIKTYERDHVEALDALANM